MKLLDSVNTLLFSLRKRKSDSVLGKVMVVSSTGFGDTLLSTPAIKTLRKSFPESIIIFLVNKKYSALFLNYKYVNTIWEYSGGYINLLSIIIRCRINNIHTILFLHSNGPEDIFISLLSGASNILKWTDNIDHKYKKLFLNHVSLKEQHNIEKKINLVRHFNPKFIDTSMSISDHFYSKESEDFFSTKKKIIGIQLGAQDIYKIWPVENVIELSLHLLSMNYFLVFFGTTKFEREMMIKIENEVNSESKCNLVQKTEINELPEILKQLNLLVTNDTGILHLSIAMKVKSLSLFGPTSSKEFGAYQDREIHKSIQKDGFFVNNKPKKKRTQDGMRLISVDEVISKIEEIV
jgi:ADP-heptose:LPS heptosyltransferase